MKRMVLITLVSLSLASCKSATVEEVSEEPIDQIYATFTLNTQEYVRSDLSQEVMEGVMALHEQYDTPIDIFFADFLVQELDETNVIQDLASNDLVAISYHIRHPMPHAGAYTELDFESMTEEERYETYLAYESFTIDPESGVLTNESGGYAYLAELAGYAPYAVGIKLDDSSLIQVYEDLGARFLVSHAQNEYKLGEQIGDIYVRPESTEIRLFQTSLEEVQSQLDSFLAKNHEGPVFINFKIHDKDFFADASAWSLMYVHKRPPYSYKDYYENVNYLSEEEQSEVWEIYEFALNYVQEHGIEAMNLSGVSELVGDE